MHRVDCKDVCVLYDKYRASLNTQFPSCLPLFFAKPLGIFRVYSSYKSRVQVLQSYGRKSPFFNGLSRDYKRIYKCARVHGTSDRAKPCQSRALPGLSVSTTPPVIPCLSHHANPITPRQHGDNREPATFASQFSCQPSFEMEDCE